MKDISELKRKLNILKYKKEEQNIVLEAINKEILSLECQIIDYNNKVLKRHLNIN